MKTMYVFHVRNKDNILLGENASTMGTVCFRRKEFSTDPVVLSYRHRMRNELVKYITFTAQLRDNIDS